MIFRTCNLYVKDKVIDDFGMEIASYIFVADIEICISVSKCNIIENGVIYHSLEITAVTPYDGFELNKSYKIVDGSTEYMCDTFISGRFTSLTLTRV